MSKKSQILEAPILFVHVGWMKRYCGHHPTSDPFNPAGFGWFKNEGKGKPGAEQFNFKPHRDGWMYGYIPRASGVDVSNLGAHRSDGHVEGILVVFVANDPTNGVQKVVGWYRDATVYRQAEDTIKRGASRIAVSIVAEVEKSRVLPVIHRAQTIPTGPGGIGRSPLWYGRDYPKTVRQVRDFIHNYEKRGGRKPKNPPVPGGKSRQQDPERRRRIEEVAMGMAEKLFSARRVERENKGWDLEADQDGEKVLIEAKGLSGTEVRFVLTPNEYQKMRKYKHQYYIFVVTSALTKKPKGRTFRYADDGSGEWRSELGETLRFNLREEALVTT